MEIVGTNSVNALNVKNLQIDSQNTASNHCPHANGYGQIAITGYAPISFSNYSGATAPDSTGSFFLKTEANKSNISQASSLDQFKSLGGVVLPSGSVVTSIKVDNNGETINFTGGATAWEPYFTIGDSKFIPLKGATSHAIENPYTQIPKVPNQGPTGTSPYLNSGMVSLVTDYPIGATGNAIGPGVLGAAQLPAPRKAYNEDRPIILQLNAARTGLVGTPAAKYLNGGQLRATVVAVPVTGTTYTGSFV